MLIADTRLDPLDEADLRWFYNDAEGLMGLRSSLGPMLDRLAEGRVSAVQSGTPDLSEVAYHAATRAKKIQRALDALEPRHRVTLRAALGPGLPAAGAAPWEPLRTGTLSVSLVLLTAQRHHVTRDTLRTWLRDQRTSGHAADQAAALAGLATLRQEATVALVGASAAYRDEASAAGRKAAGERRARMDGLRPCD